MDTPSVVLVPPSPLHLNSNGPSPIPSVSSTPELSRSSGDHDRSDSETSIPSIYSMYNTDERGSWSAPPPPPHHKGTDSDPSSDATYRDSRSLLHLNRPKSGASSTVYHDALTESRPGTRQELSASFASSDGSPRLAYTAFVDADARPSSGQSTHHHSERTPPPEQAVGPSSSSRRPSPGPASYYPSPQSDLEVLSTHSRTSSSNDQHQPSSRYRKSQEALNVSSSPALRTSTSSQRSRHEDTSSAVRPPSSRPRHSDPPLPSRPLTPPETPPTRTSRLMRSKSSPESSLHLEPMEGEDMESFHVRKTYAELARMGVKGDGYEEGVERTRAKIGTSRQSKVLAEQALADGTEKKRELSPKEVEMLASLDRYGFFTMPSHDRLVRLPAAPLQKSLVHTPASTNNGPAQAASLSSMPDIPPPAKELSRIEKWNRMLEPRSRDPGGNVETWDVKAAKEHKLRKRVYKGIPDRWRRAAWELMMARYSKTGRRELEAWSGDYKEALEQASSYDIQIDLDVPRTISGHIMFKTRYGSGQRSLFHVLHSFSLRCSECGYCQGMGPIAATLLNYFDPEHTYASLIRLHDAYDMHAIFQPGFPGLLEAIYVQERITEQFLPGVYEAFKKHMISTTSYATKWYITLFANSVPFQTQLRLWDAFLLEGSDVFVLVAVAIVWVYKDHITSSQASFETVLSLLSSFFVPEDESALLSWIEKVLGDNKLRTSMKQWRKDWKQLVATGQDGKALL